MGETFPTQVHNQSGGRLAQAAAAETPAPETATRFSRLASAANIIGPTVLVSQTESPRPSGNDHAERVFQGQEDRMINPYFNRRGR